MQTAPRPVMNDLAEARSGWLTVALRACGMRRDEIRYVLAARDPEIVRRHIELHTEWLEERLARQRRILVRVERRLTDSVPGAA